MNNTMKMIVVLTAICLVSAAALAYVHDEIAAPIITAREKEAAVGFLRELAPDADDFNIVTSDSGQVLHYEIIKGGKTDSVAIPVEGSGFGGQGSVKLIIVVDMQGVVISASVAGHSETPGYGDRIVTEPDFMKQFTGMKIDSKFERGADVDHLAGATVTSDAVFKCFHQVNTVYQEIMKGGQ